MIKCYKRERDKYGHKVVAWNINLPQYHRRVRGSMPDTGQTDSVLLIHKGKQIEAAKTAYENAHGSLTDGCYSTFHSVLDYYNDGRDLGSSAVYVRRMRHEFGGLPVELAATRLQEWLRKRVRAGEITGSTSNRYVAWATAAVNACIRAGKLKANPFSTYERYTEEPRSVTLTDLERLHLLNKVREVAPHLEPIVTFAMLVPTRKAELVGMRRSQVDMVNGVIELYAGTTKSGKGRFLPVPADMREYFRSIPGECEWAFYREERGRFLPLGDFKRSWNAAKAAAGFPHLHFHDLRAIAATRMLRAGNSKRAVMAIAGWETDMLSHYYRVADIEEAQSIKLPSLAAEG